MSELDEEEEPQARVVLEVEPENVPAVRLFLHMQRWVTETVIGGKNVVTLRHHLDRTGIGDIARALGVALDEALLDKFGLLETLALQIHAKRERAALTRS